ncbi:MAG: hypothetical protein IKU46_09570 [Peptococcaceae bacterium]|nr:hypothetical protein [Peptococcaceae bacterium]
MMHNINQSEEGFSYTYSARQQEEVQAIRQKYLPKEEDKMAQLRKLDRQVTTSSTIPAIIVGLIGSLLLGIGMCCTMIPSWQAYFVPGIVIGVIGLFVMAFAFPVHKFVLKRKQEQAAPEILKLSEEILKK